MLTNDQELLVQVLKPPILDHQIVNGRSNPTSEGQWSDQTSNYQL